ncbi:MAG: hypothetical protein HJJLKODD_00126 [Phycisphaerae bacterium]|nr:hypothetical protein [Phycisphaerae bacterium]
MGPVVRVVRKWSVAVTPRLRSFHVTRLLAGALLLQASGCFSFIGRELEALLVPYTTGNALFVHNSSLFSFLAPLLR